jgi:hypothetical protein
MLAVTVSDFSVGAASSFVASLVILAFTHLDDLHFLLHSPRRYKYLEGDWHQYHLTRDSRREPPVFWTTHSETFQVTSFGRVRGKSEGKYTLALDYKIKGNIRQHVMRLRLINQNARELPVGIAYPRLLAADVIVGFWVGHSYDEQMCAGPIVLSRSPLSADALATVVANEQLLSVSSQGNNRPPVVAPVPRSGSALTLSRWDKLRIGAGDHVKPIIAVATIAVAATLAIIVITRGSHASAIRRAYAAQLAVTTRGIEDMLKCHEKLLPFATKDRSWQASQALKSFRATLTVPQLLAVLQAVNELERLFPHTYSAPRAGTRAAYRAWSDDAALRSRVKSANQSLRGALAILAEREPHTDSCKHLPGLHSG